LNSLPPPSSLSLRSGGGLSGALKLASFEKLFYAADGIWFSFSIYSLDSFISIFK